MALFSITRNEKGFSLVEMIVVTAIFVIVLIITGQSFETIIGKTTQETKLAETQIEGAVGLEILRRDLAQAGYGLPWNLDGVTYAEVTDADGLGVPDLDSTEFNDDPPNPPRAVVSSDANPATAGFNDSDVLVVKSTITGMSETAKKWYNATFSHYTSLDMEAGERLIVLKNAFSGGVLSSKMLVHDDNNFTVSYPAAGGTFPAAFRPDTGLDTYMVYGVAPRSTSSSNVLRTPFNRSDYTKTRPDESRAMPATCAKQVTASDSEGVGILYRSTASHGDGGFSSFNPLLDCVADMQVVYSLDSNGDGSVDRHSDTPLATADEVRAQVKEVRVYILAQEGAKSTGFNFPDGSILVGERINGVNYGRPFIFDEHNIEDWRNYRWRIYTIVVSLGNLN
jgi:prepilin-type N-terminal cleavage/methylation domain-containing protein